MKRYFCPYCGVTIKRNGLYALWDAHGLKELHCKGCANEVVSVDIAFEKMWEKVMRDESEE